MKRTALVLVVLSVVIQPVFAGESAGSQARVDVDVRLPAGVDARGGFVMRTPSSVQRVRIDQLELEEPGLTFRWDGLSGSPKWVSARPGSALSAPGSGEPEKVARNFLRERSELLGLRPEEVDGLQMTSVVSAPGGGAHVHFKQIVAGLEVFDGRVNVNLGKDGAVRSFGSRLYAGLVDPGTPRIDAVEALRLSVEKVYPELLPPTTVISSKSTGERHTVFDGESFGMSPTARLVLFPEAVGARLAWDVHVAEPTLVTSYRLLIDALDGSLLFRTNLTLSAEARVLDARQASPQTEEFEPVQHRLLTVPLGTPQSPIGWISGDGTSLEGNNATTHLRYLTQPGLAEPDAVYDYAFNTASSALANAWWWVNDAHDRFYALGFDEAAGNFQADGGDALRVVFNPSGPRRGGFFHASIDGGTSAMILSWLPCRMCADHDGYPENGGERNAAFSRDTVYHEYVHGVSTRMVGGPAAADCLNGLPQSAGLGEAWGDVFASSFSGDARMGPYSLEGSGWIRGLSHDLTYDDICDVVFSGCQQHGDGMIYAGALWDLRESMRALDPAGGLEAFHRIVLEGLANTVCRPTMLDARDGMLDADTALYGSAHHQIIWNVMAARGMGVGATSTGETDTDPVTDYTVPTQFICAAPAAPGGLTANAAGDNVVGLDYDAAGAVAVEIWREDLDNPFDRAVRIAFTTNTAGFVDDTVQGGKSYRYHVVALGPGGVVCRSGESDTADVTATGACEAYPVFDPDPVVTVGDPGCALTLSWNAAQAGCPGSAEPIVYNVYRATEPGFEPSDRFLLKRTTTTSVQDVPPDDGLTYFYLVLAEHGTLDDAPDHRDRGSAQLLKWAPGLPTSVRTTDAFWDFDGGAGGWTTDNSDPAGGWVLVDPSPTYYSGTLLAPDEAGGGTGMAWVTGDAGGPSSVTAHDCRGTALLSSPVWDGTGGATILSFDYWAHLAGNFLGGIDLTVDNGTEEATRRIVGLMTAQPFETAGQHGWQRFETDLASLVEPSSTMSVTFSADCSWYFSEFGIDNVRVERAASCARPALFLQEVTVDDSPAGWGNGNGVLEPGETARLDVELINSGGVISTAPRAVLSSAVRGLIVHENSADFPDIPPMSSAGPTGPGFAVTAPMDWECLESLPLEFELTDDSGALSREAWSLELGHSATETVFEDDFETDKGWIAQGTWGKGLWRRGDPIGTMDGPNQANPEDDSPYDAGSQCYVTENTSSGDPNVSDVDATNTPYLTSPRMDLTGFKRATLTYDLWFYDSSGAVSFSEDFARLRHFVHNLTFLTQSWYFYNPTNGWARKSVDLHDYHPMVPDVRLEFSAFDRSTDHIVEMGVDNVRVEGERVTCDPVGVVNPPNDIGDTLRVDKSGAEIELSWQASPVDGTHDGAAYYAAYASDLADSGFAIVETSTSTSCPVSLDGAIRFILVSGVNPAGTSGDEPAP